MKAKRMLAMVVAAVTVLSTLSLAGCGETEEQRATREGKTLITMMGWGDTYETGIFQTMIDMFEEEYPEYIVSYDPKTNGNYMTVLTNAIANPREMPDVFYCADTEFVRLAYETNIFEDLKPYIEASDKLSLDDLYEESILAYSFNEETRELGDPNGALYGLPKDLGLTTLVYNKEYAKAAGITVDRSISVGYDAGNKKLNDQIPMTWAQYIRFAQDCAAAGEEKTGKNVYGGGGYEIDFAYLSTGNKFIVWDEEEQAMKINIDNDDYAMSVQYVADLAIKYGFTDVETEAQQTIRDLFADGQAATCWSGTWETNSLWEAGFDWDILPTPVPSTSTDLTDVTAPAREGTKNVTTLGSVCLSVYSGSKEKEGAYKLVEYLTTNIEAQKYNYENGMAVPNRKGNFAEYAEAELNDPEGMNRPQNRVVYQQQLENSGRRKSAYTYNGGNKWEETLLTNDTAKYALYHVLMKDGNISTYKPNYIVFDWAKGAMTTTPKTYDSSSADVISGKELIEWLSADVQRILDEQNGKYKYYNNQLR